MPILERQKFPGRLTETQRKKKGELDIWFEKETHKLSAPFYSKKKATGVTPEEQVAYEGKSTKLWDNYLKKAKEAGLYEELTVIQQIAELMPSLEGILKQVNELRKEQNEKPLILTEE